MRNYINYFTEVEERFQQRRGSLLLLSTLDWALIESWSDAGIPLAAVLRGIDDAFDKHESKRAAGRARRINGLAWCAQSVMEAAEQMREAATGVDTAAQAGPESGFERDRIAQHLGRCRAEIESALDSVTNPDQVPHPIPEQARAVIRESAERLGQLRSTVETQPLDPESLETSLRALEEKLLAALLAATPEVDLVTMREAAAASIAPYRARMGALQIRQISQQFVEKRLLERSGVPRLSLFYMRSDD